VTTARRVPRLVGFAVATIWLVLAVTVGALVAADVELGRIGRADLRSLHGATWVILAAIGSSSVVGSVLALRRPRHPVGWLFIGLGRTFTAATGGGDPVGSQTSLDAVATHSWLR